MHTSSSGCGPVHQLFHYSNTDINNNSEYNVCLASSNESITTFTIHT